MSSNADSLNKPSPSSQGSAPQVEKIIDALNLYVCAMDNAVQILKQALAKLEKKTQPSQTGLNEEAFNLLKWEVNKGSKLGNFEVTYKAQNPPDTWQHVFNVLKANGATIK